MKVGPKLRAKLVAPFEKKARGLNGISLVVESSELPPRFRHNSGTTRWKKGRPQKYTRATYEVVVGDRWNSKKWPRATMVGLMTGTRIVELDWMDDLPAHAIPLKQREPSLDIEEDERLFA